MSKRQDKQRFIRHYKETTGETEIDMRRVALFAQKMSWTMPVPPSPLDLLTKQFTEAAHEVREYDKKTGKPYRVWHALPVTGQPSLFNYVDIDEATRNQMLKSSVNRREQMVSDGYNLTLDLDHWNSVNTDKAPIELPMDLTLDVEIRKASDDADDDAEAA